MIDLCAKKNIYPDVKLITADKIEDAWKELMTVNKDGDRFVVDIDKSLKK